MVSWVVYDQNFCQEMADKGETNWAKIDPGIYTQIFLDQQRSAEQWCRECQAVDHVAADCPLSPRPAQLKCPKVQLLGKVNERDICKKYNDKERQCTFKNCRFSHICRICKGRHSQFLCTSKHIMKDTPITKYLAS